MTTTYQAAWVPETDGMDWDEAAELAVAWIEQECEAQGATGVLVTNAVDSGSGVRALDRFASRHSSTSPRASRSRVPTSAGPVLAYVPHVHSLSFAADLARNSSLCVVEGFNTPLGGWASAAGARNLATDEVTPEPPTELAEALERLHFYGNNGWTRGFGHDMARSVLERLAGAGSLDRDFIVGAMLAYGHSGKAVDRLGDLIEKMQSR